MNRRSFIKGLIALASAPAIGKYVNIFKTEGAREGIEQVADRGIDFFNMVIKKVMDEGKLVNESERIQTFKHPDRPDITVDVDIGSGSSSVYFDTDQGTKAGAELVKDIEVGPGYTELLENEEIYKMGGNEYYKDVQEEITGGITNLEKFLKGKKGFAAGGRVGRWMGGPLSAGKSTLREMLRHFSKGSSHGKSGAEMLKMVNPKQISKYLEDPNLLFMKGSPKEGLMATDMIKDYATKVEGERAMMINELLEAAKNIRKADKSIEQYRMEMIEAMMAKGADRQMAENLAKMVSGMAEGAAGKKPTPKLTDEGILQLENIYKNLITKDRSLNADGGRVGMFRGGIPKGLQAALRAIMSKYGDDAITTADKVESKSKVFDDFEARNPNPNKQMTNEEIEEFADEFGLNPSEEYYNWDGTLTDARRILKEDEDYKAAMFKEYKAGRLDPEAGSVSQARLSFLRQKAEQAADLGNEYKYRLTEDEVAELDYLEDYFRKDYLDFKAQQTDRKMTQEEIEELKELGEKGFKDGGDVSLTVIKIPDISESGVESLFKRR
tara:strand:- start:375 stop:2033 length:1659 start_codon:yes stop_codon:yes gene_type:complete